MGLASSNGRIIPIGGIDFDFIKQRDVPAAINDWRRTGHNGYVTLVNPHSVMMCRRDEQMRDATKGADLILPDGIGIVLAARLLGHGKQYRVTGPALMLRLCDAGRAQGLRHYFYGGREGIADRLAAQLSEMYPGLVVAGTYCPPFRPMSVAEDEAVVAEINAARPDVVWVGIGAPKQEKWMANHVRRIRARAMVGVGAAFDFHSGNVRWAPKWVRNIGCEWAYRLICEPRRMWRRNLDSPLFLGLVIMQAFVAMLSHWAQLGQQAQEVVGLGHDGDLGGPTGGAATTAPVLLSRRPRPSIAQAAAFTAT
jgi:N-acetylglucosaminyldiphosphoundecaprenol N-acetyl-beta-D-mannosaminyltransferase